MLVSHWIAARSSNQNHQIYLATHCLPYIGFQNSPHYIPTLKMATAMFAETLVNIKHSTWLSPEGRSYTLNSSRENLWSRFF
jgi:hypothetical protein